MSSSSEPDSAETTQDLAVYLPPARPSNERKLSTFNTVGLRSLRSSQEASDAPLTALLLRQNPQPDQEAFSKERTRYKQRLMDTVNTHLSSPDSSPARSPSLGMTRQLSSSSSNKSQNTLRKSPRPSTTRSSSSFETSRTSFDVSTPEDKDDDLLESRRPNTAALDSFVDDERSSVVSLASRKRQSLDAATVRRNQSPSLLMTTADKHRNAPTRSPTMPLSMTSIDESMSRSSSKATLNAFKEVERERPASAAAIERRRIRESLMTNDWSTPVPNISQTVSSTAADRYKRSPVLNLNNSRGSGTYGSGSGSSGGRSRPAIPAEFRNALQSPYLSPSVSTRESLNLSGSSGRAASIHSVGSSRRSASQLAHRKFSNLDADSSFERDRERTYQTGTRKRSLMSESENHSVDSRDELFSQELNGRYLHRGSTSPPSSAGGSSKYRQASHKSRGEKAGSDAWWNEVSQLRERIGALEMTRPISRAESLQSFHGEDDLSSRIPVTATISRSARPASSLDLARHLPASHTSATRSRRSRTSLGSSSPPSSPHLNTRSRMRTPSLTSPEHDRLTPARAQHHRLLYEALTTVERHHLTNASHETVSSVEFGRKLLALVDMTSQLNVDLKTGLSKIIEAQVEDEIEGVKNAIASTSRLSSVESDLAKLLKASDEQVRRFTEMLLAFSRFDRERNTLNHLKMTPPRQRVNSDRDSDSRPSTSISHYRQSIDDWQPARQSDLTRSKTVGYSGSRRRHLQSMSELSVPDEMGRNEQRRAKDSATSQATVRPSALSHFPRMSKASVADLNHENASTARSPTKDSMMPRHRVSSSSTYSFQEDEDEEHTAQFTSMSRVSSEDSNHTHSTTQRRRLSFSSQSATAALRLGLSSLTGNRKSSKHASKDYPNS